MINPPPSLKSSAAVANGASPESSRRRGVKRDQASVANHRLPLDWLINFFTSLKLAVACLALGLVLVFAGTLAQVDLGLFKAQNEFFRSFFIYWGPKGASWKIPVFPGGYLIGGVLLINLVA